MTEYCVYLVDENGKVLGAPRIIRGDNDDTALIRALRLTAGEAFEIWVGKRRVISVPADH